jgi:hypothetical protein
LAKSSPHLTFLVFGVVGAHDVRKYSSDCSGLSSHSIPPLRFEL